MPAPNPGLMCGSNPLAEAVTASAGIGSFGVNRDGVTEGLDQHHIVETAIGVSKLVQLQCWQ